MLATTAAHPHAVSCHQGIIKPEPRFTLPTLDNHVPSLSDDVLEYPDIWKKTKLFIIIESISNNKGIRNGKAHIISPKRDPSPLPLVEKCADLERGRTSLPQNFNQPRKSQAGIDDVLHNEEITTRNRRLQILADRNLP